MMTLSKLLNAFLVVALLASHTTMTFSAEDEGGMFGARTEESKKGRSDKRKADAKHKGKRKAPKHKKKKDGTEKKKKDGKGKCRKCGKGKKECTCKS